MLTAIARDLRDSDRWELMVTRNAENYLALCVDAWMSEYIWIASYADRPTFAFGARVIAPDAVQIWGFGTPFTPKVIRGVTKFVVRYMVPLLLGQGFREAQCLVHPDNTLSRRWLEHLGFSPEATLSDIGAEHQRLILYRVVSDVS
jgi:RimJ/RimL family protein N-acetyltransferase